MTTTSTRAGATTTASAPSSAMSSASGVCVEGDVDELDRSIRRTHLRGLGVGGCGFEVWGWRFAAWGWGAGGLGFGFELRIGWDSLGFN